MLYQLCLHHRSLCLILYIVNLSNQMDQQSKLCCLQGLYGIKFQSQIARVYESSAKTAKKISKSPKILKQKQKQSRGEWSLIEEKEYIKFLKNYRRTLQKQTGKRKNRVYKKMSSFICTRTNTQCTSHHQKMIEKYGSIEKIISCLKQACSLKQKESQTRSDDQELREHYQNLISVGNVQNASCQNRNICHSQVPLLIEEFQSIQNQYQTFKQKTYAEPQNGKLKSLQQIQNQYESRVRNQFQEWMTCLNLN